MDLQFRRGAFMMMLIATVTAAFVTTAGRSAWLVGVLAPTVYVIFEEALCLRPPAGA